MKNLSLSLLFFVATFGAIGQVKLSDLNNKTSIIGTEKIPVSGSGNPSITPNLLKNFIVSNVPAAAGANTKVATLIQAPTVYTSGDRYTIINTTANTGATTINFNSLGAKAITKNGSVALSSGDMVAGGVYTLVYDGTRFVITGSVSGTAAVAFADITGNATDNSSLSTALGGKQATLVSGTNIKTVNGSTILGSGNLSIGGASYLLQGSAPASTSDVWIDTGNSFAGAYPIRKYINGAWQGVTDDMDYYDPVGNVISKGRPYVIAYSGQSNVATSFYFPETASYGAGLTGDVSVNKNITVYNDISNSFMVYDFADQVGTSGNQWTLNSGANNLQTMGRRLAEYSGRTIRFVGTRLGGTPIAAWEAGGDMWNLTVDVINESGITYADCFVWIHGEGGLESLAYPSAFDTYRESFYDMLERLQSESWDNGTVFDSKTKIIAPSQSLLHFADVVAGTDVNDAEGTIRGLDNDGNNYHGWVQVPHERVLQEPDGSGGNTTSATSFDLDVNYFSVTQTATIGAGLSSFYATGGTAAFISTADRRNHFLANIVSYNNGSGVITFQIYQQLGAGAHTDWSVKLIDQYHWTTIEEEVIGNSMAEKFLSLPSLHHKKKPFTVFDYPLGSTLYRSTIFYPSSRHTLVKWTSDLINNGSFTWWFSAGSKVNPSIEIKMTPNGIASAALDMDIIAQSIPITKWNHLGMMQSKPIYWAYNAGDDNTSISMVTDGQKGIDYKSVATGASSASHNFWMGGYPYLTIEQGLGNGPFVGFNDIYPLIQSTTQKTKLYLEIATDMNGTTTATQTSTGKIFSNDTRAALIAANYSMIEVELTVMGLRSDSPNEGRGSFTVTRKGVFIRNPVDDFAFSYYIGSAVIGESSAGLVSDLTFTISGGRYAATLTRGATAGTYGHTSVATVKIKVQ